MRHVVVLQRVGRTCAGCGTCCTETYNAVKILPLEAMRIARHLNTLPPGQRERLVTRVHSSVARYGLRPHGPKVRYTCPFLEAAARCALPLEAKPTACLSFNPLRSGSCGPEPRWFFPAHDRDAKDNRAQGLDESQAPIPVAVLRALAPRPAP